MPSLSVMRLRGRLPLVVFVLLLLFCLLLFGLACACIGDHPGQAIDRALSSIVASPPLLELWAAIMVSALVSVGVVRQRIVARASPADLQRFLF